MTCPSRSGRPLPERAVAPIHGVSRRRFLLGAAAAGLVTACGGDDRSSDGGSSPDSVRPDDAGSATGGGDPATLEFGTYTLVQRFPQNVQGPGEVRLPFSLSTGAAEFVNDGPETLGAQVLTIDGDPVGGRLTARRRVVAPAAYYTFRPTVETPGFYTLVVDGGPEDGANFDVADPGQVVVPLPGETLPASVTPTVGESRGVDPICTRQPACPFHDITLADALADSRPVAYYVGTPAFCSTGTCAPALEALIAVAPDVSDTVHIVHAEVWTDLTATTSTEAVDDLALFYEPVLFVTDATGTIVERLDALFDESELREALERVSP